MDALRQSGVLVFLHRPAEEIYDGLSTDNRPLAQGGRQAFLDTYARRLPVYLAAADLTGEDFTSPQGTVEIARSVDRERFYRIVSVTLQGEGSGESRRSLPEAVLRRAQSLGAVGEAWLANLESTIAALEGPWDVTEGQALSGGTHGFVAPADGKNGEAYVVKIELPDSLGGDFTRGATALEKAGGQGYAKLYAYDAKRKACLLERLL